MANSQDTLHLSWQWNRPAPERMVLLISGIRAEGGGLLGIGRSPSLAAALPDAHIVSGRQVTATGQARAVEIRLPRYELPPLKAGDLAAVAYTSDGAAICMAALPGDLPVSGYERWLAEWECPKRP